MGKLQAYLRYLISVLLLFNLVHLAYGYEYADESRKAEIQQRVEELKSKIGSTYWILPNDRIRFYEKPTILAKYFCVTEAEGITITDWKSTNEIRPEIGSVYKVIFESGKVAFLQAQTFHTGKIIGKKLEFILTESEKEARIKSEKEQADMQKIREKEQADMQKIREKEQADIKKMIVTSFGDKLPPGYKGSDIKLIYERLRQKIPTKGKFEKTEEYEKRVQGIKISEVYAFLVDDWITIKYSPDDENLSVTITLFSIVCDEYIEGISHQNRFISVKESSGRVTSYLASNAFGAKTTVKKYSGIMYGLCAVNSVQKDSYWSSLHLDVSLTVVEAKKHMNALKVLLIAVPESYGKPLTLTFTGKYLAKPTFDSPVEFSYGVRGVNAEIVEIWLYNFKTGTILKKCKKWEFH